MDEEQYDLWRKEYANLLLKACEAAKQMQLHAPDDANTEWYESRIIWCQEEADKVWPSEHSWPKGGAEIIDIATKQKVNT